LEQDGVSFSQLSMLEQQKMHDSPGSLSRTQQGPRPSPRGGFGEGAYNKATQREVERQERERERERERDKGRMVGTRGGYSSSPQKIAVSGSGGGSGFPSPSKGGKYSTSVGVRAVTTVIGSPSSTSTRRQSREEQSWFKKKLLAESSEEEEDASTQRAREERSNGTPAHAASSASRVAVGREVSSKVSQGGGGGGRRHAAGAASPSKYGSGVSKMRANLRHEVVSPGKGERAEQGTETVSDVIGRVRGLRVRERIRVRD
jgi:hypothetical protein